jgi:Methylene-tetrahydrofolate reductase C terminal
VYEVRLWSVRHSRFWEAFYRRFEELLLAAAPAMRRLGYERLDPAFASAERNVKGLLFDCRMCGQCVLSQTGMSCPMNCPKQMRNGPCGGVRSNGHCEVKPEMRCVWVQAWSGSTRMAEGERILELQPPVDRRLEGSSSWLRVLRQKAPAPEAPPA